ncbi:MULTISPECIES: hypothetical protein [Falsihalocynthiibacter]|uniref:hypothetical protein n=1 Tax=Falsihalocynthiibacter TaxID=2854182 RepID=UPI00300200C6
MAQSEILMPEQWGKKGFLGSAKQRLRPGDVIEIQRAVAILISEKSAGKMRNT